MTKSLESYKDYLQRFPIPGGGGAHQAVYGAGCYGFRAGLPAEQVIDDVSDSIPPGGRVVPDSEVEEGVRNAYADLGRGDRQQDRAKPMIRPDLMKSLVKEGQGVTKNDIRQRSPVPLDWASEEAGVHVLEALYAPSELLFIGDDASQGIIGETIRSREEWVSALKKCADQGRPSPWPKIMPNPLTGELAPKKSGGGMTYRGDDNVASHRLAVVEFDNIPSKTRWPSGGQHRTYRLRPSPSRGRRACTLGCRSTAKTQRSGNARLSGCSFPGSLLLSASTLLAETRVG